MARNFQMLINGQPVAGVATFDVIDPATGGVYAQCPKADVTQLNEAVAAAKAAFPAWSAQTIDQRARLIRQLAAAFEARAPEVAEVLVHEQGKPFDQAMFEVMAAAGTLLVYCGLRPDYRVVREWGGNRVIEHRTPLGVIAAIMPWNFPLLLMMTKVGPALLTGNTMVLKPAPSTPLSTLLFAEVCREVLPPGVMNFICDQNDLGEALTSHQDVNKIAFTGSTATGKKVMRSAAATTIKRLTLELGGNDAAIVLDDVDPVDVAHKVYESAVWNCGQICFATKRVYVHESIYDVFCDEIARIASLAVVDDGMKPGTQIGPVQNRLQFEKLKGFLAEAHEKGKVISGGAPLDRPGFFIPPTMVRDIPDDARLVTEEQFGPVLPLLKYKTIDEVIARANSSEYGLTGTVWGQDLARANAVAMRIDSGTVWVNQGLAIDPTLPVRPAKQSGFGLELGAEALHEYMQAHIVNSVPLTKGERRARFVCEGEGKTITAKAAITRQIGGSVSIEEVQLAEPRAGEVLVRMVATGICHTDVMCMTIPNFVQLPIVLGHEGAGIVEQVGAGVTKVAPGDHVVLTYDSCGACPSCLEGKSSYCHEMLPLNFGGSRADGTTPICQHGEGIQGHFFGQSSFASHSVCRERNVVKIRKDAPLKLMGPLGCGIQTGAGAVLNALKPRPGQSIVVFGTGAVGLSAIMAARLTGATKIIGVDVSAPRLELAKELGATHVVDPSKEDPVEAIMRITGHGADYSFNTTSLSTVFHQAIYCLASRGTCGFVAGGPQNIPLDPNFLMAGRSLRGITEGDSVPDVFIPALVDYFMEGRLPIDRLVKYYDFADINLALQETMRGISIKPIVVHAQ